MADMVHMTFELRPTEAVQLPRTAGPDGHALILRLIDETSEDLAEQLHQAQAGWCQDALQPPCAPFWLGPGSTYRWSFGTALEADRCRDAMLTTLADGMEAWGTWFDCERVSVDRMATWDDLLDDPMTSVRFQATTPVCIQEAGDVTTMVPHRAAVFRSLAAKWAWCGPERPTLPLVDVDPVTDLYEDPDYSTLRTHSVVTHRPDEGPYIQRQGYTGACDYHLKRHDDEVRRVFTALARLAPYVGVGRAVARGCGHVEVSR